MPASIHNTHTHTHTSYLAPLHMVFRISVLGRRRRPAHIAVAARTVIAEGGIGDCLFFFASHAMPGEPGGRECNNVTSVGRWMMDQWRDAHTHHTRTHTSAVQWPHGRDG